MLVAETPDSGPMSVAGDTPIWAARWGDSIA